METTIVTINNVDIVASNENNQVYVPIRPICEALGIDYSRQLQKLKTDEDLVPVVGLRPTTGADNKLYDMVCLPLEYVFGWLFTINPTNVKPESQNTVRTYRRECYHALYNYFFEKSEKYQAREKSLERTITLQSEQASIRSNPNKTVDDFERYLQIDFELNRETAIRKSMTRDSITNIRTLFE